jgi:hypothetical protein
MDFIERMFHIAPDGGAGTFELCLILLVLGTVVVAVGRHFAGRNSLR